MSRFGYTTIKKSSSDSVASTKPVQRNLPAANTSELTGTIQSIRIFNDWAIGRIDAGGKVFNIKGKPVVDLQEGSDYTLVGIMTEHDKYGKSFDVISSAPHVQLNPKAIQKYLSNNFKGIGDKSAKKIVDQLMKSDDPGALEKFRQQILNEPWNIDWTAAGREGVFDGADEDTAGYIGRDLATRIGAVQGVHHGILASLSAYLYGKRADLPIEQRTTNPVFDAWKILAEDPYEPALTISGYGFRIADAIASTVSFEKQSPKRLRSLVHFALDEYCNSHGHAFLKEGQMDEAIKEIDPRANVAEAIKFGLESEMILLDDEGSELRYYTPKLLEYERTVAKGLKDLLDASSPLFTGTLSDESIQTAFRQGKENAAEIGLDKSQLNAIRGMLTNRSRLHILTGGPGCGKTALVESMIRLLDKKAFHFCAPTGKAAKVLTSRIHLTSHHATTIHSLFQGTDEGYWRINSEEPLDGDVLVVDESSMPSLELWKAVLDGLGENMHLIVVGDPNQLPSIQAGQVLKDMLTIPGVNHMHLNEVHRNSGGILDVVQEVCAGRLVPKDRDSVAFSHGLGAAEDEFSKVVSQYLASVRRTSLESTLLLMSRRAGKEDVPGWNTTYANAVLRDVCNPNAEKIPGTKLHINDRVIIRKNMNLEDPSQGDLPGINDEQMDKQTIRVVNGDTGTIKSFVMDKDKKNAGCKFIKIGLDDGRTIHFPGDKIVYVQHAYALTVHAAQGSEYREIVSVFTPGQPGFVNRNMLMTGLSRARNRLHVFANDSDLVRIAATPLPTRNSALVERILSANDCDEESEPVTSRFTQKAA